MTLIGTGINPTGEMTAYKASGTGITLTVGHAYIAAISYADGAAIEAALTGGAWDDLVDINPGVPFEFTLKSGTINVADERFLRARVASDETNGDYLRLQIEIDGTVELDFTNTSNNTDNIDNYWMPTIAGWSVYWNASLAHYFTSTKHNANSRLRIRAWKNGTFDGASYLYMAAIRYNKITV